MKNRHLLVLIASVLFSGQLAIAKEDKPTPTEQLFAAVENSKTTPEALSILIKAGAEVNARNNDGNSPLLLAAWYTQTPEVISVLINAGDKVNATSNDGITPLMWAAGYNPNPEVISVLIKAGADATVKNNNGIKAIDYAKENDALKDTDAYWKLLDASFE